VFNGACVSQIRRGLPNKQTDFLSVATRNTEVSRQ
jgi:hypothetical protein